MRFTGQARAWARLLRLPLCATVAGDLLAGAGAGGRGPGLWLAAALPASMAVYCAGMAANDLVDLARDRLERPTRPLPAGRISRRAALAAALGLLAIGLLLPWLLLPPAAALAWLALAAAVVAYDLGPRRRLRWWGPVCLAGCRGLDVLAGGLAAGAPGSARLLGVALLFALYGAAVTWQAERETDPRPRARWVRLLPLAPALALIPWFGPGLPVFLPLAVLGGEAGWRLLRAGSPRGARRLTGAWVRGFLLLGAAASGRAEGTASALLLAWAGLTWLMRRSASS